MTLHNRVWTMLIILGWVLLLGSAALTRGFTRSPWVPILHEEIAR